MLKVYLLFDVEGPIRRDCKCMYNSLRGIVQNNIRLVLGIYLPYLLLLIGFEFIPL